MSNKIKTLTDVNLKNKRVIVRVNFDVPIDEKGNIEDDFRIRESLPTINYLIKNRCKIVLISHLGRPEGKRMKKYSLLPVRERLKKLLNQEIYFADRLSFKSIHKISDKLEGGEILLLENLRFDIYEEENSLQFAEELAKLGEIFINEAFPVCHREHASIVGIPKFLPSIAGFCLKKEIEELNKILFHPQRPLIAIIGGAKISTKVKVINKFLHIADRVLIGGALANTIFARQGYNLADSTIDIDAFEEVDKINLKNRKLFLPIDLSIWDGEKVSYRDLGNLSKGEKALDIGLKTIDLFASLARNAKTVVWNGPLGLTTQPPFDRASKELVEALEKSRAYKIAGGGDTLSFIHAIKKEKVFDYLSTGGGAMLDYLAEGTLPGIEPLKK